MQRKALDDVPIWDDAICINQDDISERNEQVNQMGRIFRAATVLIYLSPETGEQHNELRIVTDHNSTGRRSTLRSSKISTQHRVDAAVQMFSRP